MDIIGYIHICQKGKWQKSFDMIWDSLIKYGLYDKTKEIRCGIVNDDGILIDDVRLNNPKIKIVKIGKSEEYERATLHHMSESSNNENVLYYYLHTKGIRHFDTDTEPYIVNWIEMMLYFNIQHWKYAYTILYNKSYDAYGCDFTNIPTHPHERCYSGNFWWAKSSHIQKLVYPIPYTINNKYYYNAPEHWVCSIFRKNYSIFQSGYEDYGKHYSNIIPETRYKILK